MKKPLPVLIASLLITLVMACGMIVIGASAFFNTQSVAVQNSPSSNGVQNVSAAGDAASSAAADPSAAAQIAQLQAQVDQYKQREQQYQQREQQFQQQIQQYQDQLNTAQQQISQESDQMQQVQQLLQYLQNRGLIQVDRRGRILVPND